jgi:hypothetical protein
MLSLNEIRGRAFAFAKEHASDVSEKGEAQTFWNDFFHIFGVNRRRVAAFEKPICRAGGTTGFADLLWKGTLLIEHKSKGESLEKAYTQALDYFEGLKDHDLPRYVLVCDFQRFRVYDLDEDQQADFLLAELPENIHMFGFISGYQQRDFGKEDQANIKAAERMGTLHDMLKSDGYMGHPLEVMMVRLLFCVFADDTGIFEASLFREYIETRTHEDGSDLGYHLTTLFQVLNTPTDKRQKSLDEQMTSFPHVNGKLFEKILPSASFNSAMRDILLECCSLDWSRISPAIFGSLFQSVMDVQTRRDLGAHYTKEINILKALCPLFLDGLRDELVKLKNSRGTTKKKHLQAYVDKLAKLRILDPACGCGNFLVIAYRELRKLELEALVAIHVKGRRVLGQLDVKFFSKVNVDQFYGIEIEEFPAQIALVALWLTDHQMNMELSRTFGDYYVRLPLAKSPEIVHGNALRMDWEDIVQAKDLSFIVGNPPFKGKKEQLPQDKADVRQTFADLSKCGVIDYVACWHKKAALLMEKFPHIRTAFVSTNSICQGEQVAPLWRNLTKHGVKIAFCHRTFQWSNDAKGVAAVHCVILGLTCRKIERRVIFDYETPKSEPVESVAQHINAYLIDFSDIFIDSRKTVLQKTTPESCYGSMPIDKGHLVIEEEDYVAFLAESADNARFIRKYIGGREFINKLDRYCLWLKDTSPDEYRRSKKIMERIEATKSFRKQSDRQTTQQLADVPSLFGEIRQPEKKYLLIPKVSSENREYLPMGFFGSETIASGSALIVPEATLYHFGVLSSVMHMAWMRHVCGRMKSDYQYSNSIVYNNFPWPENPTKAKMEAVKKAAQGVLDARAQHTRATLADLYDPNTMPHALLKAHKQLDRAVDAAYGRKIFATEAERMVLLFGKYIQLTGKINLMTINFGNNSNPPRSGSVKSCAT